MDSSTGIATAGAIAASKPIASTAETIESRNACSSSAATRPRVEVPDRLQHREVADALEHREVDDRADDPRGHHPQQAADQADRVLGLA